MNQIMEEIYVSTDVETDGPIPGDNSMLSFGSAAFYGNSLGIITTFEANLETLEDAKGDPKTMEWWKTQPEAWAAHRVNQRDPWDAMDAYVKWVKALPGKPVFVGYPAGFDFLFMYWYMIKFAGESPYSFSALDIKTYAMSKLKCGYREATKRNMPNGWFSKNRKHTHKALDDAIEQGELFVRMLQS